CAAPVLLPHAARHLCTRIAGAAFDPIADCPAWERFLAFVVPAPADRRVLQRWAGDVLIPVAGRPALMVHGTQPGGRTTFLDTLRRVLGSYARAVPWAMATNFNRRSAAWDDRRALLRGLRLLTVAQPTARLR